MALCANEFADLPFFADGQTMERDAVLFDGDKATFQEMGAIVGQNILEYVNDGICSVALATKPHHGWDAKATDSYESVEISVKSNYDSSALYRNDENVFVLRRLHSELRYMPALIAQAAEERSCVRWNTLI